MARKRPYSELLPQVPAVAVIPYRPPVPTYYGDGSDGVLDTTEDVYLDLDGDDDAVSVIRQYRSIRINTGHTLRVGTVTTLAQAITDDQDSFQVEDASKLPADKPFRIVIGGTEIAEVGERNGNTLSEVKRGLFGTVALAHPAGTTVYHRRRCRGLILYSLGDVVINGTIDMDWTSPFVGKDVPPLAFALPSPTFRYTDREALLFVVPPGGRGGRGGDATLGMTAISRGGSPSGLVFFGGGRGGGGAGGWAQAQHIATGISTLRMGGAGGDGTETGTHPGGQSRGGGSDLGDPGGEGGSGGSGGAVAGSSKSGKGGSSEHGGGAGGGGGSAAGSIPAEKEAGDGEDAIGSGGGLVVIIASGNVTINGTIRARGAPGANGGEGTAGAPTTSDFSAGDGAGGGGNGGGVVCILHHGSYQNNGTIDVSGGLGGSPGGEAGQIGRIEVRKIG